MVKPTWIPRVPQQIEKFFRNLLPGTNDADDLSIIKEYIDDVGPHVAKSELTGFVITCRRILGGTAERGLIPKVIHVILWRRDKLSLVDLLLAFLVDRRLLVTYYESDYAENFVKGLGEDDQVIMLEAHAVFWRFTPVRHLTQTQDPTYIIVYLDTYD
ncbi:hypothetical protein SI65_08180 [Aspergillus cristatus]|uniref:Uncharacterized protein n=1 Tax=Aspergillus cristatus TaxID=573508 RepID=A0A1E3B5V1_ASPCR|nr:hypothetical protein SI65_08180 [Aspergillus cristatus]